MRLAWFRSTPLAHADALDETASAIRALGQTHEIAVVTQHEAHDFVWRHFRAPYDLTLFDVGADFSRSFMRPYLFHYPGAAIVSGTVPRGAGSARALDRACRHSRLVIARNAPLATRLADEYPATPVRVVPLGVDPRSTLAQASVETGSKPVVALDWPANGGSLMPALAAMADGRPVIVFEMEATADWPALNPQTWQPRPASVGAPIVVSLDPRDEQHSLKLALRRLAADPDLARALGDAAHAWWQAHAAPQQAIEAWRHVIAEAATLPMPARPEWLTDGTGDARQILDGFNASVDFLPTHNPAPS